jgi:hypothetical protein
VSRAFEFGHAGDVEASECLHLFPVRNDRLCIGLRSRGASVTRHPLSGTLYTYLTNLPVSEPPGIVALLYKSRWDVEKVFDEFKNKLGETKS